MKKIIGIIGSSAPLCTDEMYKFTQSLSFELAKRGYSIVCGGLGGVMDAAARGVSQAMNPQAQSLCLIPQDTPQVASKFCDFVLPTGMGRARNMLIINTAQILIAIGGGAGTLSEIALAWQQEKTIIAITAFDGWARRLAGQKLDTKNNGLILPAATIEEALDYVEKFFSRF